MTRQAIIIGVGGTGSWVLSWLKKDLLETYGTLTDIPVRMLLLDLAPIMAEVGSTTKSQTNQQYSRFVVIDPQKEFIQLPTDKDMRKTQKIDHDARQNVPEMSHISRWYCAGEFPAAALALTDGAGQFRQLGRMALVQGLHLNGQGDKVYSTLQTLVQEVLSFNRKEATPNIDVHIVGSFAGGSGSGLFLDIAWLIRKIVTDAGANSFISGFFAMPNVFMQTPNRQMRAKAFNAWRELNRMMTIKPGENSFTVQWGPRDNSIYHVENPAYDHVYLIDSPGHARLGYTDAKNSIFPIVAEAISFFLDEISGEAYIQHIRTNLAKRKIAYPFRSQPTYSTLYVHSWKLPIYHNMSVARHQLALKFLESLLQIKVSTELDASGLPREVYNIEMDRGCNNRAIDIVGGNMAGIGTTAFITEIASVMKIPMAQRGQSVFNYANYAFDLLNLYANMPDTPEGRQVHIELAEMISYTVPMIDLDSNDVQYFINQLYKVELDLYGGSMRPGGTYSALFGEYQMNRNRGDLYRKIELAHRLHLQVFRERIRAWIENELNNPKTRVGSGLPCVTAALAELKLYLNMTIQFFQQVEQAFPNINQVENNAMTYFNNAIQELQKVGPFGKFMGKHKRLVGEWYEAEQQYLHLQRDVRAIQRIIGTLQEMYSFVENEALNRVNLIVQQLVSDNNYDRIRGLYRGVHESLQDENNRHEFDKQLRGVMTLLSEDRHIPKPSAEQIEQLVSRTKWQVDANMNIRVEIKVADNRPPIVLEANLDNEDSTIELVNHLVSGMSNYVVWDMDDRTAMDVIDLKRFASELNGTQETLFRTSVQNPPPDEVRTFYVRAKMQKSQQESVDEIIRSLGISNQYPNTATSVGSVNNNKIMVFSARELLLPENFAEWDESGREYEVLVKGNPDNKIGESYPQIRCDHLFAGEKNALELEYRDYKDNRRGEMQTLNQRLVHLLEEKDRLFNFFRLWAMGWINYVKDIDGYEQINTWVLKTPAQSYEFDLKENDMIGVINQYVLSGYDRKRVRFDYTQITNAMRATLTTAWYNDLEKKNYLISHYRYEIVVAQKYADSISKALYRHGYQSGSGLKVDWFQESIEKCHAELEQNENHQPTFAEELAYDFYHPRTDGGVPLVWNVEAHQQMLDILIPQFFGDLAREAEKSRNDSDKLSSDEPKRPRGGSARGN